MKSNRSAGDRATREESEKNGAKKRPKNRKTRLFQDGAGAFLVAAFLFFSATAREVNLLLALGALFGGFIALDYFWGRRALRRLRVSREAPEAVFAGERFDVAIEIRNESKRSASWAVAVEDCWAPESPEFFPPIAPSESRRSSAADAARSASQELPKKKDEIFDSFDGDATRKALRPVAYFPQIRAGETKKVRYSGVLPRRGLRRLVSLTATTRFPCGFFRSSERFDAPTEITVFPKIGVLTDAWNAFAGSSARDALVPTGRSSRIPDETLTVRDWRPGDPQKAIHWRATAKRGRLQSRDFEERKSQTIFVLLDLFDARLDDSVKTGKSEKGVSPRGKIERDGSDAAFRRWENVELAVAFAATLVERWANGDANFFFAINGDESLSPIGAESGSAPFWNAETGGASRRTLTRLATVRPSGVDRAAEIFAEIDSRTLADARIIVASAEAFDFERFERFERAEGVRAAQLGENALFVDASSDDFLNFLEI